MTERVTGSCLCKGVVFEVRGSLDPVRASHCVRCAKTSGNFAAMTRSAGDDLDVLCEETLTWFRSSESVQRTLRRQFILETSRQQ
jgi:hypothetical protein